jgi:hypothetical protein
MGLLCGWGVRLIVDSCWQGLRLKVQLQHAKHEHQHCCSVCLWETKIQWILELNMWFMCCVQREKVGNWTEPNLNPNIMKSAPVRMICSNILSPIFLSSSEAIIEPPPAVRWDTFGTDLDHWGLSCQLLNLFCQPRHFLILRVLELF